MRNAELAGESTGRRPTPADARAAGTATGPAATGPVATRWLVLIHHLPPKPDYFRVKVRRRLQRLGAVALKNAVYVLPRRDGTTEDFEWLLREITAERGEAVLCAVAFLDGVSDTEVEAMFNRDRDADYGEIVAAAVEAGADLARLRRRLDEVSAIDHFGAPRREDAMRAVALLEARTRSTAPDAAGAHGGPDGWPVGRTWVTRQGVHVDRMASAWLVRRFIDPAARFKFVPPEGYRPVAGELRFDMFEAEYTHEGGCCTFETLLHRFALDDPALAAIGEIVHDIDFKEAAFARAETAGVAAVIDGIAAVTASDEARLERGAGLLDGLYAVLSERGGV